MRDYVKVFTVIIQDKNLVDPSFLFFCRGPGPADQFLLSIQSSYPAADYQKLLWDWRWYGFSGIDSMIAILQGFFATSWNSDFFINGSQMAYYPPKSGNLDCFIASPRHIGYNSQDEES